MRIECPGPVADRRCLACGVTVLYGTRHFAYKGDEPMDSCPRCGGTHAEGRCPEQYRDDAPLVETFPTPADQGYDPPSDPAPSDSFDGSGGDFGGGGGGSGSDW